MSSISSALIGKHIEQITDAEEPLLHKKLLQSLRELDNLLEMSNLEIDEKKEEAVQIEITKFQQSPIRHKIILSKKQQQQKDNLKSKVSHVFSNQDTKLIQSILIDLLEESLKNTNGTNE